MGPHMFDDAILGCKAVFIGAIILALLAGLGIGECARRVGTPSN